MYNFRVSCCYIYCILTSMIIYRDTDAPFHHDAFCLQSVPICSLMKPFSPTNLWDTTTKHSKLCGSAVHCGLMWLLSENWWISPCTVSHSNTCRKGRTSQLLIYQFTSTDEHLFDIILIIYHLYIMWNWTFEMCHLWQQHITQSLCSKPFNPVHQYVVAIYNIFRWLHHSL